MVGCCSSRSVSPRCSWHVGVGYRRPPDIQHAKYEGAGVLRRPFVCRSAISHGSDRKDGDDVGGPGFGGAEDGPVRLSEGASEGWAERDGEACNVTDVGDSVAGAGAVEVVAATEPAAPFGCPEAGVSPDGLADTGEVGLVLTSTCPVPVASGARTYAPAVVMVRPMIAAQPRATSPHRHRRNVVPGFMRMLTTRSLE